MPQSNCNQDTFLDRNLQESENQRKIAPCIPTNEPSVDCPGPLYKCTIKISEVKQIDLSKIEHIELTF